MIYVLSIILFLLLIFISKLRGFKTFLCFYLNLFLIILYIAFIKIGLSPIIMAFLICILSSLIILFIINGINIKTITSFKAIMIILLFCFIIIYYFGKLANIQGFSYEDFDIIGPYSFAINTNMSDVLIGMFLICIIGTITDTSLSIASSVNEIHLNNKELTSKELYLSGMNVSRDILSTTVNTLYFAFFAEFIGFMLLNYMASFSYIINNRVFVANFIELMICFISSILILPLTTYLSSKRMVND